MSSDEKLEILKLYLPDADESELEQYLGFAEEEISRWLWHKRGEPPTDFFFPPEYDGVSIQAVVAGYSIMGAEGQTVHIENGTHRHFKYSDMVDYIHRTVVSYARLA